MFHGFTDDKDIAELIRERMDVFLMMLKDMPNKYGYTRNSIYNILDGLAGQLLKLEPHLHGDYNEQEGN